MQNRIILSGQHKTEREANKRLEFDLKRLTKYEIVVLLNLIAIIHWRICNSSLFVANFEQDAH